MDKVIDGVDVSGCEFIVNRFTENHDYCCKRYGTLLKCVNDKDCYYKQLKRLQAEYDDLHLTYAGCKTANTGLQELNKNLEEENKILNNMLKVNDSTKYDYYKFIKENEQLKEENKQLKKLKFKSDGIELLQDANLNLHKANIKYRQALQEIREICKNSHTSASEDYYRTADKIQDKINEVIGV